MNLLRMIWRFFHKVDLEEFPEQFPEQFPPASARRPSYPGGGMQKISIIVGHGNGDSGAIGWNKGAEFDYNKHVAQMLPGLCYPKQINVFYRGKSGIAGVAAEAMAWKGDITIELHLNAFNGKAKGCEVLALKDDKVSIEKARSFAESFCKRFHRIMRDEDGVKELKRADRGHFSLACVNDPAPSILVEPFFIDNKDEWIEPEVYAQFLSEWIKGL